MEVSVIWKLLGLQKKLDLLFDEGWVTLGLYPIRSQQATQHLRSASD